MDAPRPQLPPSLRRSLARDVDRAFTAAVLFSLAAHVAMVIYLKGVDWPREPEPAELLDRFVRQRIPPPPPPVPATPEPPAAPVVAKPQPRPAPSAASLEAQRRLLAERVARTGLLQVLSAKGPDGTVQDLLRHGSIDREQEEALRQVGGLTLAGTQSAIKPDTGRATGGRVSDLGGLRARARISVADVGAGSGERHAPEVQVQAPAEETVGVDAQVLARTIRGHLAQVRACYERALRRRPDLRGKLLLRFTLTAAGTVSAVEIDEDSLHDGEVASCLRAAARGWRFPPSPRTVDATFPFIFQSAGS
jgi:outer membrane biosynthesis protein TonB